MASPPRLQRRRSLPRGAKDHSQAEALVSSQDSRDSQEMELSQRLDENSDPDDLQSIMNDLLPDVDSPRNQPPDAPYDDDDDSYSVNDQVSQPPAADADAASGPMHFTPETEAEDTRRQESWARMQAWPRPSAQASSRLRSRDQTMVFMDVEFHNMAQGHGEICQLCALSMDLRTVVFNEYVLYKPLHPDWQSLVDQGRVNISPWDDPKVARPWNEVFMRLLGALPEGAVLLFKGVTDIGRMRSTLANQPGLSEEAKEAVRTRAEQKRIAYASVDALWFGLCEDYLPAFLRPAVCNKSRTNSKQEFAIYAALFWDPVLVFVHGNYTTQEAVADVRHPDTPQVSAYLPCADVGVRAEYQSTNRRDPIWHTAHTDCVVMRNITVFLLNYACVRYDLRAWVLKQDDVPADMRHTGMSAELYTFHLYTTLVVHESGWLRDKHLMPVSLAATNHLHRSLSGTFHWVFPEPMPKPGRKPTTATQDSSQEASQDPEEGATEEEIQAVVQGDEPRPNNSSTIRKARAKRMRGLLVPVLHAGDWQQVYRPGTGKTSRDEFKNRALRTAMGESDDHPSGESVYVRIERERDQLYAPPRHIGGRPWYYFPRATGSLGPRVQVMHTRACTDRKNGNEFAPESTTAIVAYYDFDRMPSSERGVPGVELRFCKGCVRYEGDEISEGVQQQQRQQAPNACCTDDDALALVLALVVATL